MSTYLHMHTYTHIHTHTETHADTPVVSVSAGEHTVVVRADGSIRTFGLNDNGQLGLGHRRVAISKDGV